MRRILGFSDASFSVARTIKPQLCLLLALFFLSWVLGSHPWLFFFTGCFSSRVLGSRPWRFFFLHVRRRLLMDVSSVSRRFLVSARACLPRSFASSRFTTILWSSSSTSRHFRAAPCATSRLFCSSSCTAVQHSATAQSHNLRQFDCLPQLGLLTPKKLSGMLCHGVFLFPVSLSLFPASVTKRSAFVSLLHVLSVSRLATWASLVTFTRYFPSRTLMTSLSPARGRPHGCEFCEILSFFFE